MIDIDDKYVVQRRVTGRVKFRNGTLIKSISTGRVYLIVEGRRCQLTTPDQLEQLGATWKDVIMVGVDEVNLHQPGPVLDLTPNNE